MILIIIAHIRRSYEAVVHINADEHQTYAEEVGEHNKNIEILGLNDNLYMMSEHICDIRIDGSIVQIIYLAIRTHYISKANHSYIVGKDASKVGPNKVANILNFEGAGECAAAVVDVLGEITRTPIRIHGISTLLQQLLSVENRWREILWKAKVRRLL